MQAVSSIRQLRNAIAGVRTGAGYTTNFYASPEETKHWVESGALLLQHGSGAVLIFRRTAAFFRLYHTAADAASLAAALRALDPIFCKSTVVSDLVGKPENLRGLVDAHIAAGFSAHTRLLRMYRTGDVGTELTVARNVSHASRADAQDVHAFLNGQLDPFSEQVPDLSQLVEKAAAGSILIVRLNSTLAGVLIYETTGLTTTLRYWHVDGRYRNQGVGADLMHAFFRLCQNSRRFLLWVIANNTDAISKYEHYGFQVDELVDDIVIRPAGRAAQ